MKLLHSRNRILKKAIIIRALLVYMCMFSQGLFSVYFKGNLIDGVTGDIYTYIYVSVNLAKACACYINRASLFASHRPCDGLLSISGNTACGQDGLIATRGHKMGGFLQISSAN